MNLSENEFDEIVIGAGTAGCLVANRMVSRGRNVALVEPPVKPLVGSSMEPLTADDSQNDLMRPSRWIRLLAGSHDWSYATAPVDTLAGRKIGWPRGKGLGGSSQINAMIWFPPTTDDWDTFRQASGVTWSNAELENAVARIENEVQPESPRWLSEASQRFLKSATANCANCEGADAFVYRRFNRRGRRWTAASWVGGESLSNTSGTVSVVSGLVDQLLFHGDQVHGVRLTDGRELRSRNGVTLSAGTIGSPSILMRSGIGPRRELEHCNIPVRVDSTQVGRNLQDHLIMPVIYSLASRRRFSDRSTVSDLARWNTMGTGPLSSNLAECGGLFLDGKIQIHVTPTHYLLHPDPRAPAAMTMGVSATRPASRGHLRLKSADAAVAPEIHPNYLDAPQDMETTLAGIDLARRLANESPLKSLTQRELIPGVRRKDKESLQSAIARFSQTLYHPVGTCAMGTSNDSVCDPDGRVRGVGGLRVLDASILPVIPTGNPSVMLTAIVERLVGHRDD